MAENQDDRSREDLGDEPSQYRLEEYRRKGIVSQSRELTGLLALSVTCVVAYVTFPEIAKSLGDFMKESFRPDLLSKENISSHRFTTELMWKALKLMLWIGAPITIGGFLAGIVASLVQVGPLLTLEPIQPDFDKINPLKGLQRMFGAQHAIDGLRIIIKVAVVLLVTYGAIKTQIFGTSIAIHTDELGLAQWLGFGFKNVATTIIGVLFLFAAIDFGIQRFQYQKNLRLTKQEQKEEFKEREGDPQIKARIRSVQREMARKRMMQAVKKADVIITNPTHIAIAVVYERDKMEAPKVVAKGADFLAQKIKQIAMEAGVPHVENVPLARSLYKSVKVGQFIPRTLYQAVAEVLAYVYRLKNQRKF